MSIELIKTKEQLIKNIYSFHIGNGGANKKSYENAIGKGKVFVASKINGQYFFTPSRFSGYYRNGNPNTLQAHFAFGSNRGAGKETTPRINKILGSSCKEDPVLERLYREFCVSLGIDSSNDPKSFWHLEEEADLKEKHSKSLENQADSLSNLERMPQAKIPNPSQRSKDFGEMRLDGSILDSEQISQKAFKVSQILKELDSISFPRFLIIAVIVAILGLGYFHVFSFSH